jgi:hypothetical protein
MTEVEKAEAHEKLCNDALNEIDGAEEKLFWDILGDLSELADMAKLDQLDTKEREGMINQGCRLVA